MADSPFHFAPPESDFERWLTAARRAAAGGYIRDAILGGLRARLYTNHLALAEAWSEIFFGPQEWQTLVRHAPPQQPTMTLYAAVTKEHTSLSAISPTGSAAVMLNRTEGEAILDVVAAWAAGELGKQAAWVARGTCAAVGGRAILVTGPGHLSIAEEIAAQASGQVFLDDPVLVRITLTRQVDGVQLAPTRIITERGLEITGARILHWLRSDAYQEPRADVFCLTLDGRDEPAMARDLDLDRCAEPYAYPLARRSVRCKLSQPPLVTDVVALMEESQIAAFSVDAQTLIARLATDQPWLPQDVVREVASAIECHIVGTASPPDERLQVFIAEAAKRLRESKR